MQIAWFCGKKTPDELYPPQAKKFSESLLRNFNDKIKWDFSGERNNVERYQFFTSVKSFVSDEIRKFAGIFDSVISTPNNRQRNSHKITRNCFSRRISNNYNGIPGLRILGKL